MAQAVRPLGTSVESFAAAQRYRTVVLTVLAVGASLVYAWLVLHYPVGSPVALLTWLLVVAMAWRPRVGLLFAFGFVQLFEQGGADQMMVPGHFFIGGLQSTLRLQGAIASPLELLLVVTFLIWLARGVTARRFDFRGSLRWPMLLFLLALVFALLRGFFTGGDMNIALWESRFLFYAVICYVLAANTVRTRQHVQQLLGISLLASGLFAIEGLYRHIFLIETKLLALPPEAAWSHDTVIFLVSLVLLVLVQQVFGAPIWQRVFGLLIVPVAVFTLLATERRAGYIAFMVTFLVYGLVFLLVHRKTFFLIFIPVVLAGAVYLPVFWNNTSMLGQPARAVRSLYEPDPRDAASNMYRDIEKANVRATIKAHPLLGVGFGKEFYFVYGLPDLSWWPFWHYEPHHNILWVWLKLGGAGFIVFFTLIGQALMRAAYVARQTRSRELRVFALFALGGIISALVFSWVDLGLVSARVTVFLGTILGTIAVLDRIDDTPDATTLAAPGAEAGT